MANRNIDIEGMSCGNCEAAVKGAIEPLSGVERVEVSADSDRATVYFSDGAEPDWGALEDAIEAQGFGVVSSP